jgi:Stress responsive A/B Barrel Domain
MFISLRSITLPPDRKDERSDLARRLQQIAGKLTGDSWVAPVLAGAGINDGDIVWRGSWPTESAAQAVTLDPVWRDQLAPVLAGCLVTGVGYRLTRAAVRPAGAGIWRALVFRVVPQGFPAPAQDLEAGLLLLGGQVSTIRSWALSRVASVEGPKAYTHVWEQEFDDHTGLTGEYMTHPLHWGVVDAFFDAESPQYVVDPQLIQVVGAIERSVLVQP